MTKPTKTLAINILRAAAGKEWKKMGNDDNNLPEITPDKLQEWMPQINNKELIPFHHIFFADCTEIPKDNESGNWVEIAWYRLIRCQLQHAEEVPIQTDEVNTP